MALCVITRQGFRKSWQMARQGRSSGPKVPAEEVPSGRMGSPGACKPRETAGKYVRVAS